MAERAQLKLVLQCRKNRAQKETVTAEIAI
jgi:hypothetical protein